MAGKFYDELAVGMVFKHEVGRTLTEADNVLFNALTMNPQPLHINEDFAAKTEFGQRIVNGLFTLGLVVGISVADLTMGTIIANVSYDSISHPHPMFHGDTLYVETEIIAMRESASRPNAGVVTMKHIGFNQDNVACIGVTRTALFLKRSNE